MACIITNAKKMINQSSLCVTILSSCATTRSSIPGVKIHPVDHSDVSEGVALALGPWLSAHECTEKELHATTTISKSCRMMPTRIFLVDSNSPLEAKWWKHWLQTFTNSMDEYEKCAPDKFRTIINHVLMVFLSLSGIVLVLIWQLIH